MPNELIWILLFLTNFLIIIGIFKLWKKEGLIAWMGISILLANIQVLKTIELFGMVATLGNIVYASSFLITDILNELYGKKEANKAVWIGFYTMVASTLIMTIGLWFAPHSSDFAQESLKTIFGIMPRIALASLIAYLLANLHDVWAFNFWKRKTNGKYLWIRNNFSTIVSQAIDSIIFTLVAFYGVFSSQVLLQIFITTYVLKVLVAMGDTPFIYWAKRMHLRNP
jgi:queuosine precursor transporter